MISNESPDQKKSVFSDVLDVLSDHAEILSLELRYESQQAARRLLAIVVTLILLLTAFLLVQVALLYGLMAAGLKVGWASLLLAVLYTGAGVAICKVFGKRDARAGRPFEATRRQVPESKQWIQNLFS